MAPELYLPCDVTRAGQMEAVFAAIERDWGKLDIALHSIAFAPRDDLHGRVIDCSLDGFLTTMDVSVLLVHPNGPARRAADDERRHIVHHELLRRREGGRHYDLMGPVKAALQTTAMYLAAELGRKGIRVHPISPGPIKTRAASGIDRFDELLEKTAERAPTHMLVDDR